VRVFDEEVCIGYEKSFWDKKFKNQDYLGRPNSFAKKTLPLIQERGLKNILDLGCGDGRDSIFFAENGLNVEAVDFSEDAIRKLKERPLSGLKGSVECKVMDYSKGLKPFADEGFGVVYGHLSLHYFFDETTEFIFDEIHRILRYGGLLLIKEKSTDDEFSDLGETIEDDMFFHEGRARRFFSEDYLRKCLKRFKIIEFEKISEQVHQIQGRYLSTCFEVVVQKNPA